MNFAHIIMSNNNHEDILKLIDEYNKTHKQVFAVDNNKRQRRNSRQIKEKPCLCFHNQ